MNSDKSPEEKRAHLAEKALNSTLAAIRDKAKYYYDLASRQRRYYSIARFFAIVLGVLAPTVVAFQSQVILDQYAHSWGIFAILVTAGTGIVTGLQGSFKWGEGYARSAIASLQLNELAGSIDLESLLYRTSPDYGLKYNELKRVYEKAWRQMQSIVQIHTQAQVRDVFYNEPSGSEKNPS